MAFHGLFFDLLRPSSAPDPVSQGHRQQQPRSPVLITQLEREHFNNKHRAHKDSEMNRARIRGEDEGWEQVKIKLKLLAAQRNLFMDVLTKKKMEIHQFCAVNVD